MSPRPPSRVCGGAWAAAVESVRGFCKVTRHVAAMAGAFAGWFLVSVHEFCDGLGIQDATVF